MNTKSFTHVEVKDADEGQVSAIFSSFNCKDLDGDVTLPGAFDDGQEVLISAYGHKSWEGALPVGKGVIRQTATEALLEGQFWLDTDGGRETFLAVKHAGPLGQWSYGYEAKDFSHGDFEGEKVRFLKKLTVDEVSPCLKGAGVGVRTLSAKSGMKFGEHVEAVMADVDALTTRAAEVVALRSEKGKAISDTSADLLGRLAASLKRLEELLAGSATDTTADDVAREFARYVSLSQGVT